MVKFVRIGDILTFLFVPVLATNLSVTILLLTITPSWLGRRRGLALLLRVGQEHGALLAPAAAVGLDVSIPVVADTNTVITGGGCATSSDTFISVCPP